VFIELEPLVRRHFNLLGSVGPTVLDVGIEGLFLGKAVQAKVTIEAFTMMFGEASQKSTH